MERTSNRLRTLNLLTGIAAALPRRRTPQLWTAAVTAIYCSARPRPVAPEVLPAMTTGSARIAGPADVDRIVEILTTAFFHDPLWGPAFPDVERRAEQAAGLWRFYITCVLRHRWTFLTAGGEATAAWIPPGEVELTSADESELERLLLATTGRETTDGILEIMARFEAARPREPHYYLGLIGTHHAHRGKGHGMRLLAENLATVDAVGAAAYLESSNPANDARYGRLGFAPRGEITAATGHVITTMWRPTPGMLSSTTTEPSEELLLVAIVEMTSGHTAAGQEYEDAVLELLDRHGGSIERRMRGTDSPTEVHLIRFRSRAGYESFMIDPDRLDHRDRIGDAAPTTRVVEVHDI